MNRLIYGAALVAIMLAAHGCATKRYGRMLALSPGESDAMDCQDLKREIAQAEAFLANINAESAKFDGRDVLAAAGDFGIGNAIEKNEATTSGKKRLYSLQVEYNRRGCYPAIEPIPNPADKKGGFNTTTGGG